VGLTLDAGALIAFERNDRRTTQLFERELQADRRLAIPAAVIGQVWRDGSRQARVVRLLASDAVEIEVLDEQRARQAGMLCGLRDVDDVIDASVVLCARARRDRVVTSDPDDLLRLDPKLQLIVV
jgi:hypothetical protein